jgi:hypothetical protein
MCQTEHALLHRRRLCYAIREGAADTEIKFERDIVASPVALEADLAS